MGRQAIYPDKYPTGPYASQREACWVFLCLNEYKAKETLTAFMNNEFERVENILMARSKGNKNSNGRSEKAQWTGFANIDLSDNDKAAIRGGILDGEDVLQIMTEMITEGHKIVLGYDPERDTVSVAVTGQYTFCKNAGITYTSFGKDITTALLVTAYKYNVVTKGDFTKWVSKGKPVDDIG